MSMMTDTDTDIDTEDLDNADRGNDLPTADDPPAADAPPRDEQGRFAAKDEKPKDEAAEPAADAKAVRVTTTTTNSGTHLLDKVNELGEAMARVEEQQAAQGSDIRGIRRDIGRLHDADREDRERAEAAHKDIWTAIKGAVHPDDLRS